MCAYLRHVRVAAVAAEVAGRLRLLVGVNGVRQHRQRLPRTNMSCAGTEPRLLPAPTMPVMMPSAGCDTNGTTLVKALSTLAFNELKSHVPCRGE